MSTVTSSPTPLEWAFDLQLQNPTQKAVLLVLAKHADYQRHTCFPSLETIARLSCVSVRTANRVINELEHLGLVMRQTLSRWKTRIYKLMVGACPRAGAEKKTPARRTDHVGQNQLFDGHPSPTNAGHPCPTNTGHEWPTNSPIQRITEQEKKGSGPALPPPAKLVQKRKAAEAFQEVVAYHSRYCGEFGWDSEAPDLEQPVMQALSGIGGWRRIAVLLKNPRDYPFALREFVQFYVGDSRKEVAA
jgi:hypothetical protein